MAWQDTVQTSSARSDWRRPLLEFLRNGASISVLAALTIVAALKMQFGLRFAAVGPALVFAMMFVVAIAAMYANITCFFEAVIKAAFDKRGLGDQFDVVDAARSNSITRVWAKMSFAWREQKLIFYEIVAVEVVILVGMTGSITTATLAAYAMLRAGT